MLVLTRKPGEALMLADEVKITVLEVKGKQVRLGIDAPAEVTVHREEIYRRIEAERSGNKELSDDSGDDITGTIRLNKKAAT